MNGFNLEMGCIDYIKNIITEGNVLEFGSGEGTIELLKDNSVISIENNLDYVIKRGDNHKIYHCPLINGWFEVKDKDKFINDINNSDIIVVDGPPRELRKGILDHLYLFKDFHGKIIFDDVNRILDYKVMVDFCSHFNIKYEIIEGIQKSFGVCYK